MPIAVEPESRRSKTAQVFSRLRQDILTGHLKPGAPLPNQKQLGRRFGVGEGTASAAAAQLMREGLVVRIPRRGTFVTDKVPTRARVMDCLRLSQGSVHLLWMERFSQFCRQNNWNDRWHLLTAEDSRDIDRLAHGMADSDVAVAFNLLPEFAAALHQRGTPVISMFQVLLAPDEPAAFPQISYDHQACGRMAVEHLADAGYHRIAFVCPPQPVGFQLRKVGFLDELARRNLPMRAEWLIEVREPTPAMPDLLREQVLALMRGPDRPQAFCCAGYDLAAQVLRLLTEAGLSVPDDVALLSAQTSVVLHEEPVPLTTVGASMESWCAAIIEAARTLAEERAEKRMGLWKPVLLPQQVFVKRSCGVLKA